MNNKNKIIDEINAFSALLRYSFVERQDTIQIWAESRWFLVSIEFDENDKALVYIAVRGYVAGGKNKTECIEFLTIYLLLFLNKYNWASPVIIGEPHPVVEGELYALYVSFSQSKSSFYSLDNKFTSDIISLLGILKEIESRTHHYFGCDQCSCEQELENQTEEKLEVWEDKVKKVKNIFPNTIENHCISSHCPPFLHCVVSDNTVIISNSVVAQRIRKLPDKVDSKVIRGLCGSFILTGDLKHFISDDEEKKHKQIINTLGDNSDDIHFYPGENFIISIGHENIIMSPSDTSGMDGYELERAHIQRQKEEWSALFSKNNYLWSEDIDDEQFEQLCLDILKREASTIWARKVGHSRDSDYGKDIILEKRETDLLPSNSNVDVQITKKTIVVQCKVSKKNTGKAQVQDIRDTIDYHDADGFLLITSSRITSALADHLNSLREKGSYLIDWWGRDELEDILDKNSELLNAYKKIVTIC